MGSSRVELFQENLETIFLTFPPYQIKDEKGKLNENEKGGNKRERENKEERLSWGKNNGEK